MTGRDTRRKTRRADAGRVLLTTVDVVTIAAVAAIVLLIVIPQGRVRRLLGSEDDVIADLADIERREEAHRASGATDANHNGKGEFAPLGAVLGERAGDFERVEGTDLWRRGGYYFTVLLPDGYYRPVSATSPKLRTEWAELAELIVAWPADPGRSGMRAYARWPGGALLQHAIDGYPYSLDCPFPDVPLIQVDGKGARIADRYDRPDWRPPAFNPNKPAAKPAGK